MFRSLDVEEHELLLNSCRWMKFSDLFRFWRLKERGDSDINVNVGFTYLKHSLFLIFQFLIAHKFIQTLSSMQPDLLLIF